jgi:esterase/lipase superfamily enzyme
MSIPDAFLICTRSIDQDRQYTAEPGETTYLRVGPSQQSYSPTNAISASRWKKAVIAAADGDEDEITGSTGDILFFVHGYNNDIPSVLWRTRTLQKTLAAQGWRGLVIGFDWPSDNSALNYLGDRSKAAAVAQRLIDDALRILVEAQNPTKAGIKPCTINVHLLGHSTGAYVIMEAFANAEKSGEFYKESWRIGQVAFIAGDVSSDSLASDSDWAKPMYGRIFRLTNYSNGFDNVLAISNAKRLGASPRAGRVGLPENAHPKSVNVDCSDYFQSKNPEQSEYCGTFNHSWHIGDPVFALDLAMTLEGSIDRLKIPTRRNDGGSLSLVAGQGPVAAAGPNRGPSTAGPSRPRYQSRWNDTGIEDKLKPGA